MDDMTPRQALAELVTLATAEAEDRVSCGEDPGAVERVQRARACLERGILAREIREGRL